MEVRTELRSELNSELRSELNIPAWSPQDRGRQDDDLTSVVEIVVGGGVDQALVALRLRLVR